MATAAETAADRTTPARATVAKAGALHASQAPPDTTLLLWGGVRDGKLHLEPAFARTAPVSLPDAPGPYRLTGLNFVGRQLFAISFTPRKIDHGGGSGFVFAIPFESEWTEALDRIELSGPEGVATLDRATGGRGVLVVDRETGMVRSILRDGFGALPPDIAADSAKVEIIRGLPREPGSR